MIKMGGNMWTITRRYFLLAFLLVFAYTGALAQKLSLFDRISEAIDLELELVTDLKMLQGQRNSNTYQEATLSYRLDKKQEESWNIHLRSRGKYRRRVCVFPPIKLKFSKEELKARGLNSDNEFKLVTHCVEGDAGKDYILREFLAYKLFEEIAPVHFKTQYVKVRYKDSKSSDRLSAWGILLEDEKALERRSKGEICSNCFNLPKSGFDLEQLKRVYLFEYLIGNTDWNTAMVRNLLLIQPKAGAGAVLVPYDFDFSGFVNASYALPNQDYQQKSVRDRVFLGSECTDAELAPTIAYFREKRPALEKIISEFKLLSTVSRDDLMQYLDSFYRELESGTLRRPPAK
jgi:hypothetical protein